MLQSISKKKIYFYLLLLLLLTSTFNFNIISKFKNLNLIQNIDITGISEKEKKVLEKNLKIFLNKNIFLIRKEEVVKLINNNNFFDIRLKRVKMINSRSNFNQFAFHLSNPIMTKFRNIFLRLLTNNKKFLQSYLGKIYKS